MQSRDLSFEEILVARTLFAKHTEGKIKTVHQLRSILSDMGQYPAQIELDAVLSAFNSKMKFEDLSRYLEWLKRDFMKPEPKDADTVRAFVALGGNHDRVGTIIADDLRNTCRRFNLTIDIDAMIREVDADGTGDIDYSEFKSMWEESDAAVHFANSNMEEVPQSEGEYLSTLRAFLTAERKDPEADRQFQRTQSVRRKQSKSFADMRSKSIRGLPPLTQSASPGKIDAGDSIESGEDDAPAKQPAPQQETQRMDPAFRRYMLPDPIVIGTRRKCSPTKQQLGSTLPPVNTPRSARGFGGSRSPRQPRASPRGSLTARK